MIHAGFRKACAQDIQRILKPAEYDNLFSTFQNLLNQFKATHELENVAEVASRTAASLAIPFRPREQTAGWISRGNAERLQLSADGRTAIHIQVSPPR